MALAHTDSLDDRTDLLHRLLVRNRIVGILRVAVPVIGVVALLALVGQIWLAGLARQYGVAGLRVDRGHLIVETPQYSGTGAEGSHYLVSAKQAQAPLDHPEQIEMQQPTLEYTRPGRTGFFAAAETARMDTKTQVVDVPGIATISGADGMQGTLTGLRSDMTSQVTTADGPVDIMLSDGTRIVGSRMHFDGATQIWTFADAVVTVPDLPRAATP